MSDFAQSVKQQADIVKVIEGYIRLRKAGAQNYSGLCPFHKEKTPSFSVHAVRQFYHCFGCGASGDVFSFVSKIENVTFPEAVRVVAQKCGIPLPKREFSSPEEAAGARLRTKLLELHEAAAAWFEEQLRGPEGALAREYLAGRGLSDEGIKKFRIGYAPDSFNALRDRLSDMADQETLRASGLLSSKEQEDGGHGRLYDRFRKRVVFPICNEGGRVIAFTARTLGAAAEGEKAGPKYINSPETPLYSKGQVLFNLDKAKTAIRREEAVLLVEGQMDCIRVYLGDNKEPGIQNVIATSGTAFTGQQVELLRRNFAKERAARAFLVFDPDAAGDKAKDKSIDLLWVLLGEFVIAGFKIYIVKLDGGLDPDRFIRERGMSEFKDAIRGAQLYTNFLIERARALHPGASADQKARALNYLLPYISKMPGMIERGLFAADAAQKLGIDSAVMREELRRAALRRQERVEARDSGLRRADRILVRAIVAEEDLRTQVAAALREHPEWFERLISYPSICAMVASADPMAALQDGNQRELVARILFEAGGVPASMRENTSRGLDDELTPSPDLVQGTIDGLHLEWLESRNRDVRAQIAEAERQGDYAELAVLTQQKLDLDRALRQLHSPSR